MKRNYNVECKAELFPRVYKLYNMWFYNYKINVSWDKIKLYSILNIMLQIDDYVRIIDYK